jgi:aminopeptidase
MIHEDFMIGSRDLDITGVSADGRETPIFRHGGWAF